ncbi:MAG TPA: hypothetical protein PKJ62_03015 [Bacteroidia bacterium]|nr:hypothetical protein [Bacteroidia bacterium]
MKRILIFISLFCVAFHEGDYTLIIGLPFNGARSLSTDNLGNAYVIFGNQLLQFNSAGEPKANYSESSLGELRSVDATNPLKLMLFYPDFSRLTLLNAQLAVQSTIHLRQLGIQQAVVVCNSMYGGYWIFDRQDFQLKKIDLNLQVVYQSGDLLSLTGSNVNPNFLVENNGFVYMNDPTNGIFVFDRYGTYFKTIPIKIETGFQVIENELLYIQEEKLFAIHLKTLIEREILLPSHGKLKYARIENQQLYLLTNDSLTFYSF